MRKKLTVCSQRKPRQCFTAFSWNVNKKEENWISAEKKQWSYRSCVNVTWCQSLETAPCYPQHRFTAFSLWICRTCVCLTSFTHHDGGHAETRHQLHFGMFTSTLGLMCCSVGCHSQPAVNTQTLRTPCGITWYEVRIMDDLWLMHVCIPQQRYAELCYNVNSHSANADA